MISFDNLHTTLYGIKASVLDILFLGFCYHMQYEIKYNQSINK